MRIKEIKIDSAIYRPKQIAPNSQKCDGCEVDNDHRIDGFCRVCMCHTLNTEQWRQF